jgi:HTH-type transcriptional regulator / antitoxin HipB
MEYRIAIARQLGSLLKSLRKERRITQQQLGERLGLSQRMVAKLESYPEKASFERVLQTLSALEVDLVLKEREATSPTSNQNEFPKNSAGNTW